MEDTHNEEIRKLTQEELNRKPRCFTYKDLVDIITELEHIQLYIRHNKGEDRDKAEKRVRNVMGELWRYR